MKIWKLKINNDLFELKNLLVSKAILKFSSLSEDSLELVSKTEIDISHDDYVELFCNDKRCFCGRLFKKNKKILGKDFSVSYSFKNVWRQLKEIVFMQDWNISTNFSLLNPNIEKIKKSRAILGQNISGEKISVENQIREIFSFLNLKNKFTNIQIHSGNTPMLMDEILDMSCEDALFRTLKWAPDIVSWTDYSGTEFPTIHFAKRNSINITHIDENLKIKNLSFAKRDDLNINGAIVIYEKTNKVEDASWNIVEKDLFPNTINEGDRKNLVITVELQGLLQNYEAHKLVTESINPYSTDWWTNHFQALRESPLEIQINNVSRISSLPRELISGSIYDWMGHSVEIDYITADITYQDPHQNFITKKFSKKIKATNAPKGIRSRYITLYNEESPPIGLAKAIYQASSDSQFEGKLDLFSPHEFNFAGKKISISNKLPFASVTSSSYDIFYDRLSLSFGPPKNLYPDSLSELFRINRPIKNTPARSTRISAKAPINSKLEIGGEESLDIGSEGSKKEQCLNLFYNNTLKVNIDAESIPEDHILSLKEFTICVNGKPEKTFIPVSSKKLPS